ncbi:hypothetical protein [Cohnella sp. CFH 77786]|nr:hypothetical protein [Cohnella sp. CFH 77786]
MNEFSDRGEQSLFLLQLARELWSEALVSITRMHNRAPAGTR